MRRLSFRDAGCSFLERLFNRRICLENAEKVKIVFRMKRIIIMAKVPRAGNVKTRLLPFLSGEQCRTLAEAFLFDAVNKARGACDELTVAFAPATERDFFGETAAGDFTLTEQTGSNLGEKIFNAFENAFSAKARSNVVMIGTDSPTLPVRFLEDAFAALETEADAVLGESADGGFYLLGLRRNSPDLFSGVEWSSARTFRQVKRNIERSKLRLKLLPRWFDVDEPDDLRRLRAEILKDETAQRIAPLTFRWLTEHGGIFAEI